MSDKTYHCRIEVRGYELDSFGHVNHAMYVSYLEHARWKLLEEENIRLRDFQAWQRFPVIARIDLSYLKPTFLGDELDVRTRLTGVGRTSFAAEQEIYRGDEQVLKASIQIVIVNEKGRPAETPEAMSRIWSVSAPPSPSK